MVWVMAGHIIEPDVLGVFEKGHDEIIAGCVPPFGRYTVLMRTINGVLSPDCAPYSAGRTLGVFLRAKI